MYSSPFWLRILFPKNLIWFVRSKRAEIYLTFDDGPIPEVTPLVLETLRLYNVKATFFCVGENVEKYPEVFKSLLEQGHAVGNHTFHHIKGCEADYNIYLKEVEDCNTLVNSSLFRPPHGQITRKQANTLRKKYKIVMWTVLTGDYNKKLSGDECLAKAIKNTKPGAIIVFHDSIKALDRMEYALPKYIQYCLGKGYTFRTLDEELFHS